MIEYCKRPDGTLDCRTYDQCHHSGNCLATPYDKRPQGKSKMAAKGGQVVSIGPCSECETPTDLCCSDCAIDLRAKIRVCPMCMDAHEARKCATVLRERLAEAERVRDLAVQERDRAQLLAKEWSDDAEQAERERDELQALLDLQHTRTVVADKEWQAATGKHNILPDFGALIDWLRGERDEYFASLEKIRAAFGIVTNNGLTLSGGLVDYVINRYAEERTGHEVLKAQVAELQGDKDRIRKRIVELLGPPGNPNAIAYGVHTYDKGYCNGITSALTAFDDAVKERQP